MAPLQKVNFSGSNSYTPKVSTQTNKVKKIRNQKQNVLHTPAPRLPYKACDGERAPRSPEAKPAWALADRPGARRSVSAEATSRVVGLSTRGYSPFQKKTGSLKVIPSFWIPLKPRNNDSGLKLFRLVSGTCKPKENEKVPSLLNSGKKNKTKKTSHTKKKEIWKRKPPPPFPPLLPTCTHGARAPGAEAPQHPLRTSRKLRRLLGAKTKTKTAAVFFFSGCLVAGFPKREI